MACFKRCVSRVLYKFCHKVRLFLCQKYEVLCKRIVIGQRHLIEINLLNPAGHVMHQQFNIQQLYVLPTLYLCVLFLSENKQRIVPLTA